MLASATIALAGCTAPSDSDSGEDVTITVMFPNVEPPAAMIDEFTAETGIKINWSNVDFDSLMTKIAASGAANAYFADVAFFNFTNIQQYGKLNWFTPLDDYVEELSVDTADLGNLGSYTWEDQLLALPYDSAIGITTVNTDLFAKAGITELPTTLDEYTADLHTIKDAGVVENPLNVPFAAAEGLTACWIQMTAAFGGESVLNEDGTPAFTDPSSPGYQAAEWLIDAIQEGLVPPGAINSTDMQGMQTLMAQGLAATSIYDYSGNISGLYNDPAQSTVVDQIQYLPVPGISGPAKSIIIADALGIPSSAKQPEAAAKFLQWFVSAETQVEFAGGGDAANAWGPQGIPSSLSAIETLNEAGKIPGGDVILDVLNNNTQPYLPYGAPEWYASFSSVVQTSLHGAAAGTMSLDDAITAMADAANEHAGS
ncbi:MAG: extracellular solute-binding protein [Protaetiibacter sp.]